MDAPAQPQWWNAFPATHYTTEVMPRHRAHMILSMRIASLLIVDVRRVDYEGGAIRGSLNIPAQGFWWNRGMLYELAYKAGMEWVVFTCGSSQGRAPRCAAWFLEHVREVAGDDSMQVMTLEGGIKGWVKSGADYIRLMDGFDQAHWQKVFSEQEAQQNHPLPPPQQQQHPQSSTATEDQTMVEAAQFETNAAADSTPRSAAHESGVSKRPLSTIESFQEAKRANNG